jgi:glycosyltransferase involved in cell wall biosynthesis
LASIAHQRACKFPSTALRWRGQGRGCAVRHHILLTYSFMKIGLIVPGFSSDSSDWCIPVLVDVVRELSRRAEVHVFALRYPPRRDSYDVHGARVHALGGGVVRGLRRPELLAAACAGVIAEHRRGAFTVLHGLWADEPGIVAVTVARLLRIPSYVSVMGGELIALPEIAYGGRLSPSNRLLTTLALRGAHRVTAGSRHPAELVRGMVSSSRLTDVEILPWGIDPNVFDSCGPPVALAGTWRVLHVGSLVPIKDHSTLLRAIAVLKETTPGVHLHLVGDGPRREVLIDQAQALGLTSSVTFHGHVERDALARYYRAAHVLAVSSRYEAQMVVALEAALCGLPLVGTSVGLVRDFAPAAAIAVPIGDHELLAEGIRRALVPEVSWWLSASAHRLVESQYLAARTAERLMAMYGKRSALMAAG